MAYRMAQIPMTFSEFEGYFCWYEWQNSSRGPSAFAKLLVCFLFRVDDLAGHLSAGWLVIYRSGLLVRIMVKHSRNNGGGGGDYVQ